MYIWQLNEHAGNELQSPNRQKWAVSGPQMSGGEEIASHIQQQDTATKALTFFLAAHSLPASLEDLKSSEEHR